MYEMWIMLSTGSISMQWIAQLVSLILTHWIVIYPVDSAIQLLNNWGLVDIGFPNILDIRWIVIYQVDTDI